MSQPLKSSCAQTVEQIDRRGVGPAALELDADVAAHAGGRHVQVLHRKPRLGERSGRCGAADDTDQARSKAATPAATATRRNQAPRNFSTKLMQLFPFLFVCFAPQAIRAAVPGSQPQKLWCPRFGDLPAPVPTGPIVPSRWGFAAHGTGRIRRAHGGGEHRSPFGGMVV